MKKLVLSVAMSSLALAACSSGSGGGSGTPASVDAKSVTIPALSQETEITAQEYWKTQGIGPCESGKLDRLNRGEQFKASSVASVAGGTINMVFNAQVISSTDTKLEYDLNFETNEASVFSGPIYANNRGQYVCEVRREASGSSTTTSTHCELKGELSQSVKDYMMTHQNDASDCSYTSEGADPEKRKAAFSKGVFTLEGGRKINVVILRQNAESVEKCKGQPSTKVPTLNVIVTSKDVKDIDGKNCDGAKVFNHFRALKGGALVQNSTMTILRAPAR